MVVCLNTVVLLDMHCQQFTLCYCLVKSLQKPSSWYSLLKCIYVTSQLCHSLAVHPLLDHYTILGNWPPTRPLIQSFSLSEK